MFGNLATKAVSGLLVCALAVTMCPAAALAYAAEGDTQPTNSNDNTPTADAGASSSAGNRVNQDVQLDTSGSGSTVAADSANNDDGDGDTSRAGNSFPAAEQTGSAESDPASTKYVSTSGDRISADVALDSDATVGTIEYNGLAYTINAEDDATVAVTGLATTKPTGEVVVPSQIASAGKTYTVTAIDVAKALGEASAFNPYVDNAFDETAKAKGVSSISLPATITAIDIALFQLFPNATDIYMAPENGTYTSFDGALYNADATQLILVPQGKGSLVLPQSLVTVPAYVFSQCNKLSTMSFLGSTGNDFLAVQNNILYTNDYTTLLAAPAGLGTSATIASETQTIAEGAFYGNVDLETIVVNGVVAEIAAAGDTALNADGAAIMSGSAVNGSTLPAFSELTVANATVVINVKADGDQAAALIESAKAAWAAYGFQNFKEPATPGTEVKPNNGASGFAFTLLPDYTLSVRWEGREEAPAALEIPDYGIIDGVQYTVSTIAANGFSNYTSIITADLPQTITTIEAAAFKQCTSLQTLNFSAVTYIGEEAFANTALLSLVLPTTVQTISANAFSNMKSTTIVALGSIANNSEIALGAAAGLNIYVPKGTEDEWDAGIPTLGNHIYPYGVQFNSELIELEVGETANLTGDGGYIEAAGDVQANYSYGANPISLDTETGAIAAKVAGSSCVNVELSIDLQSVVVHVQKQNVAKLKPIANDLTEAADTDAPKTLLQETTLDLAAANVQVKVTGSAPTAEDTDGIDRSITEVEATDKVNDYPDALLKLSVNPLVLEADGDQASIFDDGEVNVPEDCSITVDYAEKEEDDPAIEVDGEGIVTPNEETETEVEVSIVDPEGEPILTAMRSVSVMSAAVEPRSTTDGKVDATDGVFNFYLNADNLTYSVSEASKDISGDNGVVTVPATFDGRKITTIRSEAFDRCNNIETLVFSEGIEQIPSWTARWCSKLKTIKIPASMTYIKIDIDTSGRIGTYSPKLEEFIVDSNNQNYASHEGVLYDKDMTTLMAYPQAKPDPRYVMPDTAVAFMDKAFMDVTTIQELVLSDYMETFSSGRGFQIRSTSLRSVTFGSKVSAINFVGSQLFDGCLNLSDFYVKGSVKSIDASGWLKKNVPTRPEITVHLLSDQSPAHIKVWTDAEFTTIDTEPGKEIFTFGDYDDKKKTCTVTGLVKNDYGSGEGESTYLVVPSMYNGYKVTTVGSTAFDRMSAVETLVFSEGIEQIPSWTARWCSKLKTIKIPASMTYIKIDIEANGRIGTYSPKLEEFIVDSNNQNYASHEGVLYDRGMTTLMAYPQAKPDLRYVMPDTAVAFMDKAFMDVTTIQELVLSDYMETFSSGNGFQIRSTSLRSVTFGSKVSAINFVGRQLFDGCLNLSDFYVKGSVKSIDASDWLKKNVPTRPEITVHLLSDKSQAHIKAWVDAGFTTIDAQGKSYVVTFETVGGSHVTPQTVGWVGTQNKWTITKPADPTRTGYIFGGWYTNAAATDGTAWNFATAYNPTTYPDGLTLYAKWIADTQQVTVNHYRQKLGVEADAATAANWDKASETLTFNVGTMLHLGVSPIPKTYAGFTLNSSMCSTNAGVASSITLTHSITTINYYYTRNNYTFTLGTNANANTTGSTATGSIQYGATVTLKAALTSPYGYRWERWTSSSTSLQGNLTAANTTFTMPAGNLTMTPTVTAKSYTITFDGAADNVTTGAFTNLTGKKVTDASWAIPTSSQTGFKRQGYRMDATAWQASTDAAKTTAGGAVTPATFLATFDSVAAHNTTTDVYTIALKARWLENSYKVTYNMGDARTDMESSVKPSTVPASVALTAYTKANGIALQSDANQKMLGYTFAGWKASVQGNTAWTGKTFSSAAITGVTTTVAPTTIKALLTPADAAKAADKVFPDNGATIVLTAQWKPVTYTINYLQDSALVHPDNAKLTAAAPKTASKTFTIENVLGKNLANGTVAKDNACVPVNNVLTLDGYTFGGFKGGQTATTLVPTATLASNAITLAQFKAIYGTESNTTGGTKVKSVDMTAVWTPWTYTLTWDKGTGTSGGKTDENVKFTDAITVPTSGFSKAGYSLTDWQTGSGNKTVKSASHVYDIVYANGSYGSGSTTGNPITIKAIWTADGKQFVVNYWFEKAGEHASATTKYPTGPTDTTSDFAITVTKTSPAGTSGVVTDATITLSDDAWKAAYLPGNGGAVITGGSTVGGIANLGTTGYKYVLDTSQSSTYQVTIKASGTNVIDVFYKLTDLNLNLVAGDKGAGSGATTAGSWGATATDVKAQADNISAARPQAYEFTGWKKTSGAPADATVYTTEDLAARKLTDNETYTAQWKLIDYELTYERDTGLHVSTLPTFTDIASKPNTKVYRYTDFYDEANGWAPVDPAPKLAEATDRDVPDKNTKLSFGYYLDGWNGGAADKTAMKEAVFADLFGEGDTPERTARVKANTGANEYTFRFYSMADKSETIHEEITVTLDSIGAGSASFELPGLEDVDDSAKLYGYMFSTWYVLNSNPERQAYTTSPITNKGSLEAFLTPIIKASGYATDTRADIPVAGIAGTHKAYLDLSAKWLAMYVVDLPSSTYSISADTTQQSVDTGDTVSVVNSSPQPISVSAYSEVKDGNQIAKAKALFMNDINATDPATRAVLADVMFDFASDAGGAAFAVHGGAGAAQQFASDIAAAGSATDTHAISGVITMDLSRSAGMWDTIMNSTAKLAGMPEGDFAQYANLGVKRDALTIDWGSIASITWTVSAVGGDVINEDGTGTKEYKF